jgi:hypothetical protein
MALRHQAYNTEHKKRQIAKSAFLLPDGAALIRPVKPAAP